MHDRRWHVMMPKQKSAMTADVLTIRNGFFYSFNT